MHKLINLIIITCFLCFHSCSKQTKATELTDHEFYKSIPEDNYRSTVKKIDSLLEHEELSIHRRGLLFHDKERMLGLLEKDSEAAVINLKKALYLLVKKNRKIVASTYKHLGTSYCYNSEKNTLIFKKDPVEYFAKKKHKIYKEIVYGISEAKALNALGYLSFLNDDFSTSTLCVKKAIIIQLEKGFLIHTTITLLIKIFIKYGKAEMLKKTHLCV